MTRHLLILLIGSCLVGCGDSADQPGGKQEDTFPYHFEEVIVGLRGAGGSPRYLHVVFTFEIDAAKKDQALKAIEGRRRVLRDGMIVFLSNEPIEKINQKQTHDRIRSEIRKIVNERLDEPFVRRVLLDKFALQ